MAPSPRSEKQFGDFQTPPDLARAIWENLDLAGVDLVVEPTIGLANFARTAPQKARGLPWMAWDVNPDYVATASETFADSGINGIVTRKNVFELEASDFGDSASQKTVLIIGNPPWVTSAAQGGVALANLPRKWNRFGLNGLDAMTGKANFDIAEAVILSVIAALKEAREVRIALLIKRSVAMKIARDMLGKAGIGGVRFTRIDANRWFGVSVEAGLMEMAITRDTARSTTVELREDLGTKQTARAGLATNGAFVENLDSYEKSIGIEAADGKHFEWRQGLKHDLSRILELRFGPDGLVNGLDEPVDIEAEALSPLYKSSDLARDRPPRRWMPLYQHDLSGPLPDLAARWPKLANYLAEHQEQFAARKSSIYRNKPSFMLFGVGPYTLAPYKVAVSGFYKEAHFRVIGPSATEAPPLVDDTCYILPFDDLAAAEETAKYLNGDRVRAFLKSIADRKAKRPYTKALLARIGTPETTDKDASLGLLSR